MKRKTAKKILHETLFCAATTESSAPRAYTWHPSRLVKRAVRQATRRGTRPLTGVLYITDPDKVFLLNAFYGKALALYRYAYEPNYFLAR